MSEIIQITVGASGVIFKITFSTNQLATKMSLCMWLIQYDSLCNVDNCLQIALFQNGKEKTTLIGKSSLLNQFKVRLMSK